MTDHDPELTPPRPRQSEFELLAASYGDLKTELGDVKKLCERAADNTLAILESQRAHNEVARQLDRRLTMVELQKVVGPYILASIAIMLAGIALVR